MNMINHIVTTMPLPEPYKIKISRCLESILENKDDSDNNGSGDNSDKNDNSLEKL